MSPGPPTGSVRLRRATVRRIRSERPGVLELDVDVEEPDAPADPATQAGPERAVAFTELVGPWDRGIASW